MMNEVIGPQYNKTYHAVPIRSVEYLNSKDSALVASFLHCKERIPVYYQYCQTKKANELMKPDKLIGWGHHFRVLGDMVVCDIDLDLMNQLSFNFNGMIDNYTVHINQVRNDLVFGITRLLVYNKEFKKMRDQEILNRVMNIKSTVENEEEDCDD